MSTFAAIFAPGNDKRLVVHISLDLAPDGALRRTTRPQIFAEPDALFLGDFHVVVNGERAPFHDGAQHILAGGLVGQTKEYAARIAVPQRSALASHVRNKEQAVRTRRRFFHKHTERFKDVLPVYN